MTRFFYIIPGILTDFENPKTWDYQAQLWLRENGYGEAAGFNYQAGVLGGLASRKKYGGMVSSDLRDANASGFTPIIVVGHSNGCGIIAEGLSDHPDVFVDEIHLIAAAIDHDCDTNHLNAIAKRGQVKRVVLYVSPNDNALGVGPLLGYGNLGKVGPVNVSPELAGILVRVDGDCDHNDWVGRDFEKTMQHIGGN